jgi:hypothetical protein
VCVCVCVSEEVCVWVRESVSVSDQVSVSESLSVRYHLTVVCVYIQQTNLCCSDYILEPFAYTRMIYCHTCHRISFIYCLYVRHNLN